MTMGTYGLFLAVQSRGARRAPSAGERGPNLNIQDELSDFARRTRHLADFVGAKIWREA